MRTILGYIVAFAALAGALHNTTDEARLRAKRQFSVPGGNGGIGGIGGIGGGGFGNGGIRRGSTLTQMGWMNCQAGMFVSYGGYQCVCYMKGTDVITNGYCTLASRQTWSTTLPTFASSGQCISGYQMSDKSCAPAELMALGGGIGGGGIFNPLPNNNQQATPLAVSISRAYSVFSREQVLWFTNSGEPAILGMHDERSPRESAPYLYTPVPPHHLIAPNCNPGSGWTKTFDFTGCREYFTANGCAHRSVSVDGYCFGFNSGDIVGTTYAKRKWVYYDGGLALTPLGTGPEVSDQTIASLPRVYLQGVSVGAGNAGIGGNNPFNGFNNNGGLPNCPTNGQATTVQCLCQGSIMLPTQICNPNGFNGMNGLNNNGGNNLQQICPTNGATTTFDCLCQTINQRLSPGFSCPSNNPNGLPQCPLNTPAPAACFCAEGLVDLQIGMQCMHMCQFNVVLQGQCYCTGGKNDQTSNVCISPPAQMSADLPSSMQISDDILESSLLGDQSVRNVTDFELTNEI